MVELDMQKVEVNQNSRRGSGARLAITSDGCIPRQPPELPSPNIAEANVIFSNYSGARDGDQVAPRAEPVLSVVEVTRSTSPARTSVGVLVLGGCTIAVR